MLQSKTRNKIDLLKGMNLNENCLLPVKLSLLKKGRALRYAIICLPEESDLNNSLTEPFEEHHEDRHQAERKELIKEHKVFIKRMSRKRSRARKNGEVNTKHA